MTDLRYLNKEQIKELLPMQECITVMEEMFRSIAEGECIQPLRSFMMLPQKRALLGMMPGYSSKMGVMGIKVLSVFFENRNIGLPSHQGVVLLFDGENGVPL